jgi:uncharacterized membrane protein YfcA
VTSYILGGRTLDPAISSLFVLGGLAGMGLGAALSRRLAGPQLQKVFAAAMIAVGGYMLLREALFDAMASGCSQCG